MYEKFNTKIKTFISDRSYFNNAYYVEKDIITTYMYFYIWDKQKQKLAKRLIKYEFSICKLIEDDFIWKNKELIEKIKTENEIINNKIIVDPTYKIFTKSSSITGFLINDLTEELNNYCPDPTKQKIYFVNEPYYKGKNLPYFYGILHPEGNENISLLSSPKKSLNTCSINKINRIEFNHIYKEKIENLIYEEKINPKMIKDFPSICLSLGSLIYNFIIHNKLDTKLLREYEEQIDKEKKENPLLYYFFKNITDSYGNFLIEKGVCSRCSYNLCNKIMKSNRNKKFCSMNVDGQDCKNKNKNFTQYYKKRLKHIENEIGAEKMNELLTSYLNIDNSQIT